MIRINKHYISLYALNIQQQQKKVNVISIYKV